MTTFLSNVKPRELWCPFCNIIIISDAVDTVCNNCEVATLITVTYSPLTGERITGIERKWTGLLP